MKCIKCYREIDEGIKFCVHCGTMQPVDREAYEREHPELASAISDEELNKLIENKSNEMQQAGPMTPPAPPTMPPTAHARYMPQPPQYTETTPPQFNGNTQEAESVENSNTEVPNENMLQCPECGNMVDADSNSCPNCGCPFVLPNDQWQNNDEQISDLEDEEPVYYPDNTPQKKGMSGWAKGLIAFAITLLVAAAGGAVYYFFFMNNVKKLNVDPEEVLFTRKGGEKKVTVDTDAKEFKVTKSPDWVKVDINGDEITIKCEPLPENGSDREDIIRISAGDKREKITIKQSAKATYLSVDGEHKMMTVGHEADNVEIPINTDGNPAQFDYKCQNEYGSTVDWIYIYEKTSTGVTLMVEHNRYSSERRAEIIITSGKHTETVMIKQKGQCYSCNGEGREQCSYCDGAGQKDCYRCYGEGKITCYECDSDGQQRVYNSDLGQYVYITCRTCGGTQKRNCPDCGGDGRKFCDNCNGRGYNICERCNGSGETSDD